MSCCSLSDSHASTPLYFWQMRMVLSRKLQLRGQSQPQPPQMLLLLLDVVRSY